jgi:hypothetical protein
MVSDWRRADRRGARLGREVAWARGGSGPGGDSVALVRQCAGKEMPAGGTCVAGRGGGVPLAAAAGRAGERRA